MPIDELRSHTPPSGATRDTAANRRMSDRNASPALRSQVDTTPLTDDENPTRTPTRRRCSGCALSPPLRPATTVYTSVD